MLTYCVCAWFLVDSLGAEPAREQWPAIVANVRLARQRQQQQGRQRREVRGRLVIGPCMHAASMMTSFLACCWVLIMTDAGNDSCCPSPRSPAGVLLVVVGPAAKHATTRTAAQAAAAAGLRAAEGAFVIIR